MLHLGPASETTAVSASRRVLLYVVLASYWQVELAGCRGWVPGVVRSLQSHHGWQEQIPRVSGGWFASKQRCNMKCWQPVCINKWLPSSLLSVVHVQRAEYDCRCLGEASCYPFGRPSRWTPGKITFRKRSKVVGRCFVFPKKEFVLQNHCQPRRVGET